MFVLTPIISHNLTSQGALSVSTSSYGGWSVFVGANAARAGMFNRKDAAILSSMPGHSWWERSEAVGRLGVQRIIRDPVGFAGLAVRKFSVLWADDTFAVGAAGFIGSNASPSLRATLSLLSQLFYALVAVAAAIALVKRRQDGELVCLMLGGIVLTMILAHTFLEVQPRYHAYLVPVFGLLAASLIAEPRCRINHDEMAGPID